MNYLDQIADELSPGTCLKEESNSKQLSRLRVICSNTLKDVRSHQSTDANQTLVFEENE